MSPSAGRAEIRAGGKMGRVSVTMSLSNIAGRPTRPYVKKA